MPVLQKDDYDTWAMEMEHYLEYIDNEVWKVIQNGNSKKRVTKGKDGVYRVLPPTQRKNKFAEEKERKASTLLLMLFQKIISDVFMAWMMPKRSGQPSRQIEDANHKFLRSLLPRGTLKASSSKHKPSHSSGSYSSYTTSSSKATTTATPGLADEVIHSFLATNADDVDLIHEDLDQIDDLDLEEMDINWQIAMTAIKIKKFYKKTGRRPRVDGKMHVAFDKRKVECFNCHNTGHFARECKFKGSKEGSRQEAGRGQDFKPVRTEKEALMTIDEGQINWVEQTTDEELNHALMAFTVNNEVSMCSKLCLDSYNALQAKYDELQSEFGDQEAALVAHKLAVKKLESQLKASHKQQSSLNEKLNFQANQIFEKDERLRKIMAYINAKVIGYGRVNRVSDASSIVFSICPSNDSDGELGAVSDASSTHYSTCPSNDSDGELGAVSDASSTHYSTCPSNDSNGELGAVSDHSVNDDPIHDHIPIPSIEQVTIATQKTQPQVLNPSLDS
ncbi:ribonuclease H-like domain-containing protein [Tanacetum coccineum]